jgi:hypothetical protein
LALVTSEKIEGEYGPSAYHLIDLQTYPGHSGGPVWVAKGKTLFLLGIMVAGYPVGQELLVPMRGEKSNSKVVKYYSLGISLVTPVEKLKEILLSPAMEEKRKRDEPKPI